MLKFYFIYCEKFQGTVYPIKKKKKLIRDAGEPVTPCTSRSYLFAMFYNKSVRHDWSLPVPESPQLMIRNLPHESRIMSLRYPITQIQWVLWLANAWLLTKYAKRVSGLTERQRIHQKPCRLIWFSSLTSFLSANLSNKLNTAINKRLNNFWFYMVVVLHLAF